MWIQALRLIKAIIRIGKTFLKMDTFPVIQPLKPLKYDISALS